MTNGNQLLERTLQLLSPDIFFHPLWLDILDKSTPLSTELTAELSGAAQQLQADGDLDTACQIRLLCTVLQDRCGDNEAALANANQVRDLAANHELTQALTWATWGAGAICARHGQIAQAAEYLSCLQDRLNEADEWMLASMIWLVKQSLLSHSYDGSNGSVSTQNGSSFSQATESTLNVVSDWLFHWGETDRILKIIEPPPGCQTVLKKHLPEKMALPFLGQSWRSIIDTGIRIVYGERQSKHEDHPPMLIPIDLGNGQTLPNLLPPTQIYDGTLSDSTHSDLPGNRLPEWVTAADETRPETTLTVYTLGAFRVYQNDQPVEDWASRKAQAIFKYLVAHHQTPVSKEVLMDIFWPEAEPDPARNNLNVAIYSLRQTLRQISPDLSHILFQNDHYRLNPALQIWVDADEFKRHFNRAQQLEQRGELHQAMQHYRAAEALYQGEFFADDRYEDWLVSQRQQLEANYLNLLNRLSRYYLEQEAYDAWAAIGHKMLAVDPCQEDAHQNLMRYYIRQNQRYLALRQYHLCVEALEKELDVAPSESTVALYQQHFQGR